MGHTGGLKFEKVRAGVVDTGDKQTDTVGALAVMLSVRLGAVADLTDNAVDRERTAVGHAGAERLLLHEVGEHPSVRCQTGDGDAHVGVDFDDLLLVRGQLFGITLEICLSAECAPAREKCQDISEMSNLEADQHGMCLVDESHYDGTLLDGFLCIFDLEDPALRGAVESYVSNLIVSGEQNFVLVDEGAWGRSIQGDRIVVVVVSEHGGSLGRRDSEG